MMIEEKERKEEEKSGVTTFWRNIEHKQGLTSPALEDLVSCLEDFLFQNL